MPRTAPDVEAGQRNRDQAARRSRERTIAVQDIGNLPAVADPERRKRCGESLEAFCVTYLPKTFYLEFSDDHRAVLAKAESAVRHGGLFAVAMPRGSGKTAIARAASLWAILYGYHQYVYFIGANAGAAKKSLEAIKSYIWAPLILADFPEAVFPLRKLERQPHKCAGQTCHGEPTLTRWSKDAVAFPTIPGSPSSGAVFNVAGLTSGFRGADFAHPSGAMLRPSLVIPDDPQTDKSAKSLPQCEEREAILSGAVLGLAGPDVQISGIMPLTVIRRGDMADRMLDQKGHPEWNGSRHKLVYDFPTNQELWDQYREIQLAYDSSIPGDNKRAQKAATELYRANREAMDAGARLGWPARFHKEQLSAVQYAQDLRYRDERAFWAEYQNEPLIETTADPDALTPEQIAAKINRLPKRTVPPDCTKLTAMIDVQGSLLYYAVCGFASDFTGAIVDYGAWPDQRRPYFALRDAQITLADATGKAGMEAQIYEGLTRLTKQLLGSPWHGEGGAELRIERCHIDAGFLGDVVKQFCRESEFAAQLTPSHGKGIGAGSNPLTPRKPTVGEEQGLHWYKPARTRQAIKYVIFDSNFWKSFLAARLAVAPGSRGCLMLFGDSPALHRMLADHLTSERRDKITSEKTGRKVDEWTLTPNCENHWLDCVVGCHVAASVQGVSLDNVHRPTRTQQPRQRLSIDEMKRRAREGKR